MSYFSVLIYNFDFKNEWIRREFVSITHCKSLPSFTTLMFQLQNYWITDLTGSQLSQWTQMDILMGFRVLKPLNFNSYCIHDQLFWRNNDTVSLILEPASSPEGTPGIGCTPCGQMDLWIQVFSTTCCTIKPFRIICIEKILPLVSIKMKILLSCQTYFIFQLC